ncbi:hypothetical protein BX667DRAFT_98723 [Coemansia mojavensis]|nr:hypothetical protein BX667DRAFT_98723 [Coemansia mojavensis]
MSRANSISSENSLTSNGVAEYLCPICLQTVDEQAFTDPCYHQFCFLCIMQWIEHKPSCPLCKRTVAAVIQPSQTADRIIKTPINQTCKAKTPYGPSQHIRADLLGARKRESVYQHGLHRTSPNTRRISNNPQLLKKEIATRRCREWISRDLQVILAYGDVAIIESLVVGLVRERGTLDIEPDLGVLGNKARLFLDELEGFVNSTLDIRSYDIYSVYTARD